MDCEVSFEIMFGMIKLIHRNSSKKDEKTENSDIYLTERRIMISPRKNIFPKKQKSVRIVKTKKQIENENNHRVRVMIIKKLKEREDRRKKFLNFHRKLVEEWYDDILDDKLKEVKEHRELIKLWIVLVYIYKIGKESYNGYNNIIRIKQLKEHRFYMTIKIFMFIKAMVSQGNTNFKQRTQGMIFM